MSARTRNGGGPRGLVRGVMVVALAGGISCKSLEPYLTDIILVGGTILQVAALQYNQGQYAGQVGLLMATLTPAAISMTSTWVENRRQKRELAELAAMEQQINAEYAALEQQVSQPEHTPGTSGSGNAAQTQGGETWTNAAQPQAQQPPPQTSSAYGSEATLPQPGGSPSDSAYAPAPSGPSASPWGDRYTEKGVAPAGLSSRGATEPLVFDAALLKRVLVDGRESAEAIEDGAVLHDGSDGSAPADRLRLYVRPRSDAYVYVVAIDALARVQPLFPPRLPPEQPVGSNQAILLPAADDWYGLDEYQGIQHVYFYASRERNRELEAVLYRFASQPLPTPEHAVYADGRAYTVSEPSAVERDTVSGRGLTGLRPVVVEILSAGSGTQPIGALETTGAPGDAAVLTRYFEHR